MGVPFQVKENNTEEYLRSPDKQSNMWFQSPEADHGDKHSPLMYPQVKIPKSSGKPSGRQRREGGQAFSTCRLNIPGKGF